MDILKVKYIKGDPNLDAAEGAHAAHSRAAYPETRVGMTIACSAWGLIGWPATPALRDPDQPIYLFRYNLS
jgi:hypothetical protein